ncbi:MAG: GldG family protein [Gammaproteobacteria bacterium]|nr:GldG family protein [Gammaproteobacteria bacterium]
MKINPSIRKKLRRQDGLFVFLLLIVIALLAGLSQRYTLRWDVTESGRNSLSEATEKLLSQIDGPVRIDAYARELEFSQTRTHIADLVQQYQRLKSDIELNFINPDSHPQQVKDLGIRVEGEMIIRYQGRQQHLTAISEQDLSNTLLQLQRRGNKTVYFIASHGERKLTGDAKQDLGLFSRQLLRAGLEVNVLRLAQTRRIPDDAALLVIASPNSRYLEGEIELLLEYIEAGGNLLWLMEPEGLQGLDRLASHLGIELIPGTISDPTGELLGISNAAFTLITGYPDHPVTQDLDRITLLPLCAALEHAEDTQWQATPLLTTSADSWSETGTLDEYIQFDTGEDIAGPLDVSFALQRTDRNMGEKSQQRIVVLGDGDFLSNAYLGNGANLALGLNIINWLSHEDEMLRIQKPSTTDIRLQLDTAGLTLMGLVFIILVPVGLLMTGAGIWYLRKRR